MQFSSIVSLFEAQVNLTPKHIAVLYKEQSLPYCDLNHRANRLAKYINAQYREKNQTEIPKGTFIGILMSRSPDLIVSVLAILKLGCAYVSVDPTYPPKRTEFIFSDIHIEVLLHKGEIPEFLKNKKGNFSYVDVRQKEIEKLNPANLDIPIDRNDLCYAIYSSGSSGKPKGILIEHKGVPNLARFQKQYYSLNPHMRVLQATTFNWDGSVFETFSTLISGAALCIVDDQIKTDPILMADFLEENRINVAVFTSKFLQSMPLVALPELQYLNITSEICNKKTLEYWARDRNLINAYGPTEATVCSSFYTFDPDNIIPGNIGKPITETEFHLLDLDQNPVAQGELGELYISGIGLARGYINLPELTESTFIKNFQGSQKTVYRTGDFIRKLPDGNYEYVGRADRMAKINGYTLQLGEVENIILMHKGIAQAIVTTEEIEGQRVLIAFCTCREKTVSEKELKEDLATKIPGFMMPHKIFFFDRFPLLPNGKIDLQRLRNHCHRKQ